MIPEIIDIAVTLGSEAVCYPGDEPYRRGVMRDFAAGDDYELSRLSMSAHSGTHLDAPAHFIRGGKRIDEYAAADFVLPAHVIEVMGDECVRAEALDEVEFALGAAILFRTENSRSQIWRSGQFREDYVYVSQAAARRCAELGARLVGIDYASIDPFGSEEYPAHRELLGRGILVLEGIDLAWAEPGRYTLICPPLKLAGAEGAPARAILMR